MEQVAILSFLLCLAMVWLGRPIANRLRLVDDPSVSSLKIHTERVPILGGLVLFVSIAAGLVLANPGKIQPIFFDMLPLLLLGLVDDIWRLRPLSRLLIQVAVVSQLVITHGVVLVNLGGLFGDAPMVLGGVGATLFTIFAFVGLINAINLIDGLDGLAGGLVAIALALILFVALALGVRTSAIALIVATLSALAAFLMFNSRHPWNRKASVFLGDSGSLLLGLILGAVLFKLTQAKGPAMPAVLALWILMVPLFDACSVTIRRLLQRKNPMRGDKQHIHHLLMQAGFSHAQTVWILLGVALLSGAAATLAWFSGVPDWALMAIYLLLAMAFLWWVLSPDRVVRDLESMRLRWIQESIVGVEPTE
jgi:UDP-GlcNAc:undecaprenyl-phosphate/decaprenyl-phosphate GlcNAc-1-phosphate transferase